MNRLRSVFFLIIASGGSLITYSIRAQDNQSDLTRFLTAGQEDAGKLIEAYVQPVIKGVSYGMIGGWYQTGKAHKTLGFDIGVSVSAVFIPTSDNYFNPASLGLKVTTLTSPQSGNAPTIFGPKDATIYSASYDPDGSGPLGTQSVTFDGPEGLDMKKAIGFAAVPVPMAQIGIGVYKNTDLKVRFLPEQTVGANKIKMFGVGVMHDIKQHIPGIKLMPFDLSVLVAYNSVSGFSDLSNTDTSDSNPDSPDGKMNYKLDSWVVQGIISRKISVLTVYGGVGYNAVKTNVDIKGQFTIVANPDSFVLQDPLTTAFKNNSLRLNAGIRLKFGPIYLNGDYTLQKYSAVTVGLGVTVR